VRDLSERDSYQPAVRDESFPGAMMRNATRMSAAICVILAMLPTALAQTVLSADVIKQSFAGNTAEIVGQSNTVFVFYAPDGTQRMLHQASGRDSGTWRITPEGEFCGKWVKLRNGAEVCAPVIDLGGGQYQWGNSKFRLLLGNPKDL
jgi:hypothetical protein